MYVFDLEPQLPADFAMANWFASTHPAPPFQRFVMVENVAGGERRKIVNRRYVVEARNGVVASEREFANGEEMAARARRSLRHHVAGPCGGAVRRYSAALTARSAAAPVSNCSRASRA